MKTPSLFTIKLKSLGLLARNNAFCYKFGEQ